ncbi:hypothetical protein Hanom_Chr06g00556891 [Helianthus anomalus]
MLSYLFTYLFNLFQIQNSQNPSSLLHSSADLPYSSTSSHRHAEHHPLQPPHPPSPAVVPPLQ